jgi:hypothetical protein
MYEDLNLNIVKRLREAPRYLDDKLTLHVRPNLPKDANPSHCPAGVASMSYFRLSRRRADALVDLPIRPLSDGT